MNVRAHTYSLNKLAACIIMMLSLLWLTVSTPFIYEAQKELEKQRHINIQAEDMQEGSEECNPFGNNTEEKTESGSTTLSEYLQYIDELSHMTGTSHKHDCAHSFAVYVAFHGELLSPPPNSILS
jgi:hypothetical protein